MSAKKQRKTGSGPSERAKRRGALVSGAGASGAIVGAVVGAVAGPPGIVAGAVLGAAAGGLAETALEREMEVDTSRSEALDAEIGVSSGELGAPNLDHPPARIGAFSAASLGVSTPEEDELSEGPIERPRS